MILKNIDRIKYPDNLLEGTGNTLKHIKIKEDKDVNEIILTEWLTCIAE